MQANPKWLLRNDNVIMDYSSRIIKGLTPFQAALCAGDIEFIRKMIPYFYKFESGLVALENQINEIFPNGIDEIKKEENTFNFNEILQSIKNASPKDVKKALNKK